MRSSNCSLAFFCAGTALLGFLSNASAADTMPLPAHDDWTYTLAPYVWAAGINGDVGVFGQEPVAIDLGFSDILPDLKFAGMGAAEAHNGTWGVLGDMMYVHTNPHESITRIISNVPTSLDVSIDTRSFTAAMFGEYRIASSDQLTIDLLAGARFWDVSNEISATLTVGGAPDITHSGSDGAEWIDPMVGVKTKINTSSPVYISAWAMVGGFGVGSKFAWDIMGGVGYKFTDRFSTLAGYRAVSVNYDHNGFVYDIVQKGPFIGGVYQF